MFNKTITYSSVAVAIFLAGIFFASPVSVFASVSCNGGPYAGGSGCGQTTSIGLASSCTIYDSGNSASDVWNINCTPSTFLRTDAYTVGNFTAQIFTSNQGSFGGTVYGVSGGANAGSSADASALGDNGHGQNICYSSGSASYSSASGASIPAGTQLTAYVDTPAVGGSGSGTGCEVSSGGNTTTANQAWLSTQETDCLTTVTGGGYVPSGDGVCTFVSTNPPVHASLGGSGPGTITIPATQNSVTTSYSYWNAGGAGSLLKSIACTLSHVTGISSDKVQMSVCSPTSIQN